MDLTPKGSNALPKRSLIKRRKGYATPAPGRKPGSARSLLEDPDRFRIALYVAATDCLGMGKYRASYLATLILMSSNVVAEAVQQNIVAVSGNPGHTTNEADKGFVRKVTQLIGRLSPIECDWLAVSASSLAVLIAQNKNPIAMEFAINNLVAYEWRETLLEIVDRLRPALLSNIQPTDE